MPVATAFSTAALSIVVASPPAFANCAGEPPDEVVVPLVEQRWQALQQMQTYPWGTARVYDRLEVDRRQVWFNARFDQLRGTQKQQAVEMLQLGSSPFRAYASDGRLLSARYDGCTRFDTLTERSRYSYYYNEIGRSLPANTPRDQLRNIGRPAWRQVRYPIAAATERSVRTLFWNRMGYAPGKQRYVDRLGSRTGLLRDQCAERLQCPAAQPFLGRGSASISLHRCANRWNNGV
ncbi:MAG: hypothetical protein HC895_21230 [Leptolyngbyaceae cyanobacterium SM1_3_5]|nr:hypothetical protein [Leptolyngbyaceae cyanobacterium SM1_3_5]